MLQTSMFDYFQGEFVAGPAEQGVACQFPSLFTTHKTRLNRDSMM